MGLKSKLVYLALVAVILAALTQEVECRRKVLVGRKVLTRTYFNDLAIPAWAVIVLVGLGEIIVGAIVYVIMKKIILDTPLTSSYAVAPSHEV